jgi:hypothetical protein
MKLAPVRTVAEGMPARSLRSAARGGDRVGRVEGCRIVLPDAAHALRGSRKDCGRGECHQGDEEGVFHHILRAVINPKGV